MSTAAAAAAAARGAATATAAAAATTVVGGGGMSRNQLRHCLNVVRRLKKHNCAAPFLEPVDIVAFNIPNYPDIIKHPMDLGTLERNLTSKRYKTVESFSRDARLIFNNCYTFNGPDSPISLMAKELEIAFTSDMKNIPPPDDLNEVNSNEKQPVTNKKSGSAAHSRGVSDEDNDYVPSAHPNQFQSGYNSSTQKNRPTNASGGGDAQLKFCAALIREVTKNQYQEFAYPFYEPVDWKALNIPDYPLAVKHPMDIGTIRKKLERGKYTDASQFEADFRLMLNNCFIYNPPGNAVHEMGRKLEDLFNRKWKALPQKKPAQSVSSAQASGGTGPSSRPIASAKGPSQHGSNTAKPSNAAPAGVPNKGGRYRPPDSHIQSQVDAIANKVQALQANLQPNRPNSTSATSATSATSSAVQSRRPSKPDTSMPAPIQRKRAHDGDQSALAGVVVVYPPFPEEKRRILIDKLQNTTEEHMGILIDFFREKLPRFIGKDGDVDFDIEQTTNEELWIMYCHILNEPLPQMANAAGPSPPKRPATSAAVAAASTVTATATVTATGTAAPVKPRNRPQSTKDDVNLHIPAASLSSSRSSNITQQRQSQQHQQQQPRPPAARPQPPALAALRSGTPSGSAHKTPTRPSITSTIKDVTATAALLTAKPPVQQSEPGKNLEEVDAEAWAHQFMSDSNRSTPVAATAAAPSATAKGPSKLIESAMSRLSAAPMSREGSAAPPPAPAAQPQPESVVPAQPRLPAKPVPEVIDLSLLDKPLDMELPPSPTSSMLQENHRRQVMQIFEDGLRGYEWNVVEKERRAEYQLLFEGSPSIRALVQSLSTTAIIMPPTRAQLQQQQQQQQQQQKLRAGGASANGGASGGVGGGGGAAHPVSSKSGPSAAVPPARPMMSYSASAASTVIRRHGAIPTTAQSTLAKPPINAASFDDGDDDEAEEGELFE